MLWYSHLFKNFPQFVVIHTGKGFGIVNKAEVDIFPEISYFFDYADHSKLENSERGGNTRPLYLLPEKSVCKSRSNS